MSRRLPEVKLERNGSQKVGTLCAEHLALLERSYSLIIKEYTDLNSQYSAERENVLALGACFQTNISGILKDDYSLPLTDNCLWVLKPQ